MAMNWVVAGKQSMEMHGYLPTNQEEPAVMVKTSGSGMWTFKFTDRKGTGRIQVSKGADYNPLDLIETLYHHISNLQEKRPITPRSRRLTATKPSCNLMQTLRVNGYDGVDG